MVSGRLTKSSQFAYLFVCLVPLVRLTVLSKHKTTSKSTVMCVVLIPKQLSGNEKPCRNDHILARVH